MINQKALDEAWCRKCELHEETNMDVICTCEELNELKTEKHFGKDPLKPTRILELPLSKRVTFLERTGLLKLMRVQLGRYEEHDAQMSGFLVSNFK